MAFKFSHSGKKPVFVNVGFQSCAGDLIARIKEFNEGIHAFPESTLCEPVILLSGLFTFDGCRISVVGIACVVAGIKQGQFQLLAGVFGLVP